MKPLTFAELDLIARDFDLLIGASFNEVYFFEDIFGFKFWNEKVLWFSFSVKGKSPWIFVDKMSDGLSRAPQKPIFTFLRSHFRNRSLQAVTRKVGYGRVLELDFGEGYFWEIVLFQGKANFSVSIPDKGVHFFKPSELVLLAEEKTSRTVRDLQTIREQIILGLPSLKKEESKVLVSEEKKQLAIKKVQEGLQFLRTNPYLRLLTHLQTEGDSSIPVDLLGIHDSSKSVAENIQVCSLKISKTEARILRLEERLKELQQGGLKKKPNSIAKGVEKNLKNLPKMMLNDAKVYAFCGRNARENLKLIRESKPWHMWFHLRDYPSAHVVVALEKGNSLSESDLQDVSKFLFGRGAPRKLLSAPEVKFEVIYTECRFVRPIKGAKSGLVRSQNHKARVFKWSQFDAVKFGSG